jgi:hypothetical protein
MWVRGLYSGLERDMALPGAMRNPDGMQLTALDTLIDRLRPVSVDSLEYEDDCCQ